MYFRYRCFCRILTRLRPSAGFFRHSYFHSFLLLYYQLFCTNYPLFPFCGFFFLVIRFGSWRTSRLPPFNRVPLDFALVKDNISISFSHEALQMMNNAFSLFDLILWFTGIIFVVTVQFACKKRKRTEIKGKIFFARHVSLSSGEFLRQRRLIRLMKQLYSYAELFRMLRSHTQKLN